MDQQGCTDGPDNHMAHSVWTSTFPLLYPTVPKQQCDVKTLQTVCKICRLRGPCCRPSIEDHSLQHLPVRLQYCSYPTVGCQQSAKPPHLLSSWYPAYHCHSLQDLVQRSASCTGWMQDARATFSSRYGCTHASRLPIILQTGQALIRILYCQVLISDYLTRRAEAEQSPAEGRSTGIQFPGTPKSSSRVCYYFWFSLLARIFYFHSVFKSGLFR